MLKSSTLDDYCNDILKVAAVLGCSERGRRWHEMLHRHMVRAKELRSSVIVNNAISLRVALLESYYQNW